MKRALSTKDKSEEAPATKERTSSGTHSVLKGLDTIYIDKDSDVKDYIRCKKCNYFYANHKESGGAYVSTACDKYERDSDVKDLFCRKCSRMRDYCICKKKEVRA